MSIKQPKWKTLEYSRKQVIKAGKTIKGDNASDEEIKNAIQIIDNWRAAHAYPLHVIYMNLRRMAASRSNVIVAERLKRLNSIISKLKRESDMNLWRMQDLGGCRVIVPKIDDVRNFSDQYESSRKRHVKKREKDYIENPKASGYRSLHVIYSYRSEKKKPTMICK